jgi:hypothetical protein
MGENLTLSPMPHSTVLFTRVSMNSKTGPIPVSMSNKSTCPDTCPLKHGGCYAKGGPINLHWERLSKGLSANAITWKTFCDEIRLLPRAQLWRHNQAGDLPGEGNTLDTLALALLVAANKGKRGFTYTHKPTLKGQAHASTVKANANAIAKANKGGFTVNLSADTLTEADELASQGIGPVVVLLPETQTTNTHTPQGRKVVVCPAITRERVSCSTCQLCQRADRSCIVGFPAHGVSTRKADTIAKG